MNGIKQHELFIAMAEHYPIDVKQMALTFQIYADWGPNAKKVARVPENAGLQFYIQAKGATIEGQNGVDLVLPVPKSSSKCNKGLATKVLKLNRSEEDIKSGRSLDIDIFYMNGQLGPKVAHFEFGVSSTVINATKKDTGKLITEDCWTEVYEKVRNREGIEERVLHPVDPRNGSSVPEGVETFFYPIKVPIRVPVDRFTNTYSEVQNITNSTLVYVDEPCLTKRLALHAVKDFLVPLEYRVQDCT